jgi:hypothetical protein
VDDLVDCDPVFVPTSDGDGEHVRFELETMAGHRLLALPHKLERCLPLHE